MQAVGWFSVLEFVWHCIFIDPLTFAFSFRYVLLSLVCLTSAIMRVHSPASPNKATPIANEEDTGPIQTCGCADLYDCTR